MIWAHVIRSRVIQLACGYLLERPLLVHFTKLIRGTGHQFQRRYASVIHYQLSMEWWALNAVSENAIETHLTLPGKCSGSDKTCANRSRWKVEQGLLRSSTGSTAVRGRRLG